MQKIILTKNTELSLKWTPVAISVQNPTRMLKYHISLIRCRGYYFIAVRFVQPLFEGGVYVFGKPAHINDGWIRYE